MNDDLQHVVEHSLGPDWHLFVPTRTHDDSDDTLIYVSLGEAKLQMMIVTIEPDEATVVWRYTEVHGAQALGGWPVLSPLLASS